MKALILIDLQNEWRDETSPYYLGDLKLFIDKINRLIDFCRIRNYKIIFIRHVELDGKQFKEETQNTQLFSALHKKEDDIIITKHKISPFFNTTLDQELKDNNIQDVVICGILTNLCVRSCIQDAYDRDLGIEVVTDCCTAFNQETHEFTLNDLQQTREEIKFLVLDDFEKR